jgi:hypothetical protein
MGWKAGVGLPAEAGIFLFTTTLIAVLKPT